MTALENHGPESRSAEERLMFARGVLEILKNTGLFNFLIKRALEDLDSIAPLLPSALEKSDPVKP